MSTGNSALILKKATSQEAEIEKSSLSHPEVFVLGISHKNLSLIEREKFQLSLENKELILNQIKKSLHVDEVVIFNTCNRVELVWTSLKADGAISFIKSILENIFHGDRDYSTSIFYHHKGINAVRHIFKVASSLDSLVIGESQIFGQVKDAYRFSQERGLTGACLNKLFDKCFSASKKVKTETRVSEGSMSVCSVAKDLAHEVMEDLTNSSLLLLGAGEMAKLSLHYFKSAGIKNIYIANRSFERGDSLAKEFGAEYITLDDFNSYLSRADIIVGAAEVMQTGTDFLNLDDLNQSLKMRKNKPQLVLDLAVPRNFPAALSLDNVYHFNLEQLQKVAADNLQLRSEELANAEMIINDAVAKFIASRDSLMLQPVIAEASLRFDELRRLEIERTLKKFNNNSYSTTQIEEISLALDSFSQALISKTISRPLRSLKEEPKTTLSIFETFKRFFSE